MTIAERYDRKDYFLYTFHLKIHTSSSSRHQNQLDKLKNVLKLEMKEVIWFQHLNMIYKDQAYSVSTSSGIHINKYKNIITIIQRIQQNILKKTFYKIAIFSYKNKNINFTTYSVIYSLHPVLAFLISASIFSSRYLTHS